MLVVNHYAVMMSEQLWDDPQTFRPERFIKNGVVEIPEAYIPFGLGEFKTHFFIGLTKRLRH